MKKGQNIKVLLINGNKLQSEFIKTLFDDDRYDLYSYLDGKEAFDFLSANEDMSIVVIISYQLKNMNGLEIMSELNNLGKEYGFLFLTADKTVERAIEAMKAGALDFIPKTGNLETDLIPLIKKVYNTQQERLEQKRIRRELDEKNRELAKLSIVARETNNAVAIYNSEMELEWVNHSFEKLYGYSKNQYKKAFGSKITDNVDDSYVINQINSSVAELKHVNYSSEKTTKQGEPIWVQTTLSPVLNGSNKIAKLVAVEADITELKRAEARIRKQKKNITDSINYARKIQTSILPDENTLAQNFPDSFILYMPKDVVSGDFPWYFKHNGVSYVAAVDCTGHGVPGALLSFVGVFNLINIVDHDKVISSGEILDLLDEYVKKTLRQNKEGSKTRDGMDIALCKIDTDNMIIEYSGAHRPLYLLRNNEITVYNGDKRAIGGNPLRELLMKRKMEKLKSKNKPEKHQKEENFKTHSFQYKKGDRLYMFSDGLPDQFMESKPVKYSNERIRELILKHQDKPMEKQNDIFKEDFLTWKGNDPQLDDVLLIGIQL
jgi:PAS domain S-box-containing protein